MKRTLAGVLLVLAGCGGGSSSQDAPDASEPDAQATPVATCTGRAPATSGRLMIESGGVQRTYDLHIPPGYDPTRPAPLVLNFHGWSSNAGQQQIYSKMIAKSDAAGFIAVHPEGLGPQRQSWNAGGCCEYAVQNNIDDVGFVSTLLDELERTLCIDKKRVFATGMSNGGMISHRLACDLGGRIAAVAPVAGHNVTSACTPARPMPVLHFHGTADGTVPYAGGSGWPGVRDSIVAWAQRDGCGDTPTESFRMGDAHCETWPACQGGAEVALCTIEGGGHTWPGGIVVPSLGHTSTDLSATDMMWEFFQRHPLP